MKQQLEVTDLRVQRSHDFALTIDRLSLSPGKILCIAGPNGSGKTTLIDCLSGLLAPQRGRVTFGEYIIDSNLGTSKFLLGLIPDNEDWFIKELCAREYFDLLIGIYGAAGVTNEMPVRLLDLASVLHFTEFNQPLEQLSHGNKKKVQIIAALLHQPKVIVVDEVRNGLDPLAIIAAERTLRTEAKRGACVVAATHDLWWAERMADEILLLIDGKLSLHDKTQHIVTRYGSVEGAFLRTVKMSKNHAH
jgi:ABC-2 type transport system ATP-binding protein